MKRIERHRINAESYQTFLLPQKNHSYYDKRILDAAVEILDCALEQHSRVFCFFMAVEYPLDYQAPNSNQDFQLFKDALRKYFTRENLSPKILWVREKSNPNNHHYHLLITLNGHKLTTASKHYDKATKLWQKNIQSYEPYLVHISDNPIMIDKKQRSFFENRLNVLQRTSYLAKFNTKDNFHSYEGRNWGFTKT